MPVFLFIQYSVSTEAVFLTFTWAGISSHYVCFRQKLSHCHRVLNQTSNYKDTRTARRGIHSSASLASIMRSFLFFCELCSLYQFFEARNLTTRSLPLFYSSSLSDSGWNIPSPFPSSSLVLQPRPSPSSSTVSTRPIQSFSLPSSKDALDFSGAEGLYLEAYADARADADAKVD